MSYPRYPTQAELAERRRQSLRACYPRADEPWTMAEDRRLLRLVDGFKPARHGQKRDRWTSAAKKLQRTDNAVQTRYYMLQAGLRLARMLGQA